MLVAKTKKPLQEVISTITLRALKDAPGLTVTGAIVEWKQNEKFGDALRNLSEKVEQIAGEFPAATGRFAQLPPVRICADSHLPAEHLNGEEWISAIASKKRSVSPNDSQLSLDQLDKVVSEGSDARWFAIIHIDGNGAGAAFIGLSQLGDHYTNAQQLEWYRILSEGLDSAAKTGVEKGKQALDAGDGKVPLIVLVNAGDDVTVICDGADAFRFIKAFLTTFEAKTEKTATELKNSLEREGVTDIEKLEWLKDRFTAAAGIALCKPHYPFHAAYDLAEELIQSAKRATREESSFDVHQLSDVGATSLAAIRSRRTSQDRTVLWGGPYTLKTFEALQAALTASKPKDDDDDGDANTAKLSRRSIGKLRAAAFLTEADFARAKNELASKVPTELTKLVDSEGDLRRVIVDIADLAEWWG